MYFAFLPILVVYLIGLSLKRNTIKYFQKHSQVRTFRDNQSYLEQDAFFRKIRNNSYETCAAIFKDTSNLLSHKLNHNNFLEDPIAIPWSGEQEEKALLFRNEILNILQGALLQGNSGDFPDQQRFYYEIAQMKFVRTVCETGFNAGTFNRQIILNGSLSGNETPVTHVLKSLLAIIMILIILIFGSKIVIIFHHTCNLQLF